jgi:hypothetical protein
VFGGTDRFDASDLTTNVIRTFIPVYEDVYCLVCYFVLTADKCCSVSRQLHEGAVAPVTARSDVLLLLIADMGQFGLSATNSHWGYSAANPYSSYLGPAGALGSCAAAGGSFSAPALGFSTAAATAASDLNGGGQGGSHDAFGAASAVTSREYCHICGSRSYPAWSLPTFPCDVESFNKKL